MNFVIPMAGRGSRFTDAGYKLPKMLIETHGKTLLEWSVDSLPLELCTNLIFIGLNEHNLEYSLEKRIRDIYGALGFSLSFLWLDGVTRGQAETVMLAHELVNYDTDLLIFNIDTYFSSPTLKDKLLQSNIDGVIGAFISVEDRFSYASVNDDTGFVMDTVEKQVISQYALTGLYHFKRTIDFFNTAKFYIQNNITSKGEFYIAPMYAELIKQQKKFVLDLCEEHWILGTPNELLKFEKEFQS